VVWDRTCSIETDSSTVTTIVACGTGSDPVAQAGLEADSVAKVIFGMKGIGRHLVGGMSIQTEEKGLRILVPCDQVLELLVLRSDRGCLSNVFYLFIFYFYISR